ncbi:MAG TPA: aminotransferase class I/II-fold pyridoxal phosphate-dependent enzyme, partial [Gemmatimonadetes bacterium]|nr:aminotransferase class I/II-fold pyridoxal phosphate-dependent enzyme [Gemmatimonadota bacterium]
VPLGGAATRELRGSHRNRRRVATSPGVRLEPQGCPGRGLVDVPGVERDRRSIVVSGLGHDRVRAVADFAVDLIKNHKVAVVPGTTFGAENTGRVRITLAADSNELEEGVRRLISEVER